MKYINVNIAKQIAMIDTVEPMIVRVVAAISVSLSWGAITFCLSTRHHYDMLPATELGTLTTITPKLVR